MVRSLPVPVWCAFLLLGAGCFGNFSSPFPPGLEPIEDTNLATYPPATASEMYPEELNVISGSAETHVYAHGKGYLRVPLVTAWAAFRDPEVCTDRREVDEYSFLFDVETGYDYSYVVHNVVHQFITVEFDITWRSSAIAGTKDAPELVAFSWQKTEGTVFIDRIAGSVLLEEIAPGVTAVEIMEHIDAYDTGPEQARQYILDYFGSAKARVHGQPLPTY